MVNSVNPVNGPEPGYRLDEQIGHMLRLAYQRHTVIFQKRTLFDLTPTQFTALVGIARNRTMLAE